MKGMRVQSIIRELRGEKIDIIEHNEDPVIFAANALSPAKINHVSIVDVEQKHLEVIVDDTQLSLAIGKKGQNVRLAAKLLGWRIDIKREEEKRQEIESQMAAMALRGAPVSDLKGLGDKTLEKLRGHGVETVEQLAQMTPDDLTQIQGIGGKAVERIRRVVTDYFEQDREAEAAGEAAAETGEEVAAAAEETSEVEGPAEEAATEGKEVESVEATGEAEAVPTEAGAEVRAAADETSEVEAPAEEAATEGEEASERAGDAEERRPEAGEAEEAREESAEPGKGGETN
jgi:N utilization substance protein A